MVSLIGKEGEENLDRDNIDAIAKQFGAFNIEFSDDNSHTDTVGGRSVNSYAYGRSCYEINNYLDNMAMFRYYGLPQLLVVVKCNHNWHEYLCCPDNKLNSEDEIPSLYCRVFKQKIDSIMNDLVVDGVLGEVAAASCQVVFDDGEVPFARILLSMKRDLKRCSSSEIDSIMSAEIPEYRFNPSLYGIVTQFMMNDPCSGIISGGTCSDRYSCGYCFPRGFSNETSVDSTGELFLVRRNDGKVITKNGFTYDNRHVISYNGKLLLRYRTHIEVRYCNFGCSINDIGPRTVIPSYDKEFGIMMERRWSKLGFKKCFRTIEVFVLPLHLPDQDSFSDNSSKSKLVAWMHCNKKYFQGRQFTYVEFPMRFKWHEENSEWEPRDRGFAIGRLMHVSPTCGELYYMWMLLGVCRGSQSFQDILMVNGILYSSFKDACIALGIV